MTPLGAVHLVFSLLAILFGAVVLMLPKGTRWHRSWGHGYFWAMVGVVATALSLYNLTGRLTPFHFFAVVAGATVAAGLWSVLSRRPKKVWIEAHANWMAWSYVGLLAAFVAESLTRFAMPLLAGTLERNALWPAFWILVAVGSAATIGVGAYAIRRRLPGAVASTPAAMRRERQGLDAGVE